MKKTISKLIEYIRFWLLVIFAAHIITVLMLRWLDVPKTLTMWLAEKELERKALYFPVPIEKVSRNARLAFIAAEDQRFPNHWGIDFKAIQNAIEYNRRHAGAKLYGASTITQQTAKNVFLWPSRTWLRKGVEAWFALLIEGLWGKRRIFETYLNVAEMGKGVFGIEAAARQHFHKPASRLTRWEAATIAAAMPAPRRHFISRPDDWLCRRRNWILGQMRNIENREDLTAFLEDT
jgi:monofunctional biosynthetic peptidoglycan transglycosylase